ncbi:hypothetical protein [Bradyrhizobium sp. CB2312]|uniref:hypothetical protein n=1 Tax=Bradyrhizobium sp. CB2312 TaxID=3039155 RepID=UPI0024B1ACB3|nr:hypothetical protein [Bradyrhizobium sp. CB2312]WFU75415.1 hypothetical protein QA642_16025 [Bradyrhizobium sp. CB2312]
MLIASISAVSSVSINAHFELGARDLRRRSCAVLHDDQILSQQQLPPMSKALLELAYRLTLDGLDLAVSSYPFCRMCRCE